MSFRFIFHVLGKLLILLAGVMCIPMGIALTEIRTRYSSFTAIHENVLGFVIAIIASCLVGALFMAAGSRQTRENSIREGFAIVTFGWIMLALLGSVPMFIYFLSQSEEHGFSVQLLCFTNAYFENMSGFTGTGATILTDIEALPKGLLFWRSLTQWLGGMGVATLALAIFPAFGVAAYQIFRGESPGPEKQRLTPQLVQTAKVLWGVYVLLTFVQTVLLFFGGMSLFDACCHAFATMATGGFSTKNLSVGAFNSAYIDWVIICFMFLSGMNFMIHYSVIFGKTLLPLKQNREFHFYTGIILIAITASFILLSAVGVSPESHAGKSFRNAPLETPELIEKLETEQAKLESLHDTIRNAAFQVVSIATTTGFATADFDVWPNFVRYTLVLLMFFGGCAGSTSGGIKMVRILILLKTAWREIKIMIQPRLIAPIKIAGKSIDDNLVSNILGFVVLYMILFVTASLLMCLIVPDIITAATSVLACMSNIGPGLAGVGPAETFAWIPIEGKWLLILCMLLGRLEIYTVLIALIPRSYRK